jgi:hypothetical protein
MSPTEVMSRAVTAAFHPRVNTALAISCPKPLELLEINRTDNVALA